MLDLALTVTRLMHERRLRGTAPKFEVGTAHASVPPIFREVVLLDAWQNRD